MFDRFTYWDLRREVLTEVAEARAHHVEMLLAEFLDRMGPARAAGFVLVEEVSRDGLSRKWFFQKRGDA